MGGCGQSLLAGMALLMALSAPWVSARELPLPPQVLKDLGLKNLAKGKAAQAIDGQTLRLADGRVVRLAAIEAPRPPLGYDRQAIWRRTAEATAALDRLAVGQEVLLYGPGSSLRADRHGRLLAQVTLAGGRWLQGALLTAGMARVYTAAGDEELAPALYAAEGIARAAAAGLWNDPYYGVHCADALNNATDATRVVQGRVLAVADINGALYLNFGEDYRSDFTIRVERRDRRRLGWRQAPKELEGALVEVRGWVYWFNGPTIDLDHGARLRRLTADSPLVEDACRRSPD